MKKHLLYSGVIIIGLLFFLSPSNVFAIDTSAPTLDWSIPPASVTVGQQVTLTISGSDQSNINDTGVSGLGVWWDYNEETLGDPDEMYLCSGTPFCPMSGVWTVTNVYAVPRTYIIKAIVWDGAAFTDEAESSITVNPGSGVSCGGYTGVYLCDDEGCSSDPPRQPPAWRRTTVSINNLCNTTPSIIDSDPSFSTICGQVGSIRICGLYDVRLYDYINYGGNKICFEGTGLPGSSVWYRLDSYNINLSGSWEGWNIDTESVEVLADGACTNPGVTEGAGGGAPNCGNGTINPPEECDFLGPNLNSQSCQSRGFSGGTLGCNSNCTFNTSQCTGMPSGNGGTLGGIKSPINATSFEALVGNITNFIFWVALALAPLLFLIAGFYILTAGGDPNRVTTGKRIMIYTLIGFAIILFARGLIALLQNVLGVK